MLTVGFLNKLRVCKITNYGKKNTNYGICVCVGGGGKQIISEELISDSLSKNRVSGEFFGINF
jgi:hypothetical protein